MDRERLFAVAQLMSAFTALDLAYKIIQNIPTSTVLELKIDIGKKCREIEELAERAIMTAKDIDDAMGKQQ